MQSTTKTAAADCGQGSVHPGQGCVTVESENKCGWFCSDTQPDGQLTICLREQRAHRWSWLCRIRTYRVTHMDAGLLSAHWRQCTGVRAAQNLKFQV